MSNGWNANSLPDYRSDVSRANHNRLILLCQRDLERRVAGRRFPGFSPISGVFRDGDVYVGFNTQPVPEELITGSSELAVDWSVQERRYTEQPDTVVMGWNDSNLAYSLSITQYLNMSTDNPNCFVISVKHCDFCQYPDYCTCFFLSQ